MKKIKQEIDQIVKNYKINKKYLRGLIKRYIKKDSRMDYYVTHPNYLYPLTNEIREILYREHGIPHLIFDDILKYMSDEVEQEAFVDGNKIIETTYKGNI